MFNRRQFTHLFLSSLGLSLANCSKPTNPTNRANYPSSAAATPVFTRTADDADLLIWWEQGFLPEENEQLNQLVRQWEQQTGQRVDLKLLSPVLIEQQLKKFIEDPDIDRVPDIVYSVGVDTSIAPKLAWRDQLLDLTEVIQPIRERYTPTGLAQVFYHNQRKSERSYYAVPLWQADDYMHCWGNLLEEIGFTPRDLPRQWDRFWDFWRSAQVKLRAQGHDNLYGIGLCMSASGFDTYTALRMFMNAYRVSVVDASGELVLAAAENRQRFIDALSEFTGFYQQGYVPPAAVGWSGAGNNNSFLNREILMTYNLTLSIPLTQKLTNNPYNRDARQRYQQIATIDRPRGIDGTELLVSKGIKQAIVPKTSRRPEAAKRFLSYLIQPENLGPLLKGFKGRVLPVMPELFNDPFWQDPSDPHLSAARKIYAQPGQSPYEVIHPALSEVQSQQLWAKTVLKVIQDQSSTAEAVDWSIAAIQDIWKTWEDQA